AKLILNPAASIHEPPSIGFRSVQTTSQNSTMTATHHLRKQVQSNDLWCIPKWLANDEYA
ncbi:MAG: hypothetical protein AAF664_23345, partial [Planctomycetota bacterium]